jgi:hypothetical protein
MTFSSNCLWGKKSKLSVTKMFDIIFSPLPFYFSFYIHCLTQIIMSSFHSKEWILTWNLLNGIWSQKVCRRKSGKIDLLHSSRIYWNMMIMHRFLEECNKSILPDFRRQTFWLQIPFNRFQVKIHSV